MGGKSLKDRVTKISPREQQLIDEAFACAARIREAGDSLRADSLEKRLNDILAWQGKPALRLVK